MPETIRAMAAMSGGVDSSVAALLLTRAGYDAAGAMLKLFENEDIGEDVVKSCCSLADRGDAERVAALLDIPFYVFNYAETFRARVMDAFADAYFQGLTPNPCVACNEHLKFGALAERAAAMGYSHVATGHYARIERGGGRYLLKKGADASKDQTYALYFMTQAQLSRTLFPLGALRKTEVRELARAHGLENARKPDSQDICFVPNGDYTDFLAQYTGKTAPPGDFTDARGNRLGTHRGITHYTIGQRRGLGLSSPGRLYVTGFDRARNAVILGEDADLFAAWLTVRELNLIAADRLDGANRLEVKIRYSHAAQPATVRQTGERTAEITFDTPQRAVTPGQYAVMYDGDVVVGGGVIGR
ncbi:MAG: tRNA 2-thiouridine(34) synthase MnmA [Oscillospiraceae bacterium]|jgi:tRNA-specific 2-thiouridylase|nr:tRNA 2-thiouridine(34) synthase MnmA [Oscillospiraceae bacterium]